MKFFYFLFISTLIHSYEIQLIDPCENKIIAVTKDSSSENENLGRLTLHLLDSHGLAYIGSENGINSMLNTPTGIEAIEVVNDETLRAYGWCYSVDGQIPNVMPDEIIITPRSSSIIKWYYAYSTSHKNEWIDYCRPSYEVSPDFLCSNQDKD